MSESYGATGALDGAVTATATTLVLAGALSPTPSLPARLRIAAETTNKAEIVLVTAINTVTLTVQRNYERDATSPGGTGHADLAYVALVARSNGVASQARPQIPASPTAQDVATAMVATGLVTQAP